MLGSQTKEAVIEEEKENEETINYSEFWFSLGIFVVTFTIVILNFYETPSITHKSFRSPGVVKLKPFT